MCALPRSRESGAFSIGAADGSRGSENAMTPHGRQLLAASGIKRSAVAARASASRSAANRVVMAASVFLLAPAVNASEYSVTLQLEGRALPRGHVVGILHCRVTALPRVLLLLAQSDVERAAAGAPTGVLGHETSMDQTVAAQVTVRHRRGARRGNPCGHALTVPTTRQRLVRRGLGAYATRREPRAETPAPSALLMAPPTPAATGGGNAFPICRYVEVFRPENFQLGSNP